MTDRDKVIRGLEACIEPCCRGNDCPYFYEYDCGVLKKDAIQLLKEQEPVAPRKVKRFIEYSYTAVNFIDTYYCGNCGEELPDNAKYCPSCGRAVKWDE